MAISAATVKELREKTGAGMMDCKNALVEADGDLARAADLLREKGIVKAGKRAGRATSEGRIVSVVSDDGSAGALIELNCETDFVAKTDEFEALASVVSRAVLDASPKDVDALNDLSVDGQTIGDAVVAAIAKLGENVQIRRFERVEAGDRGRIATYIHAGGKIGSLVAVEADDASASAVKRVVHDVCLHVAAMAPQALSRDELPAAVVDKERKMLALEAESEGKPAKIIEKMVEGRMSRFFKDTVLLEQPLVMDPDNTVEKAAKAANAVITRFCRLQLGEKFGE